MRQNKIGAMFLVSILALAGLGITYAGFSDTIYVYGTVDTATVDIDWIGWYSGTWVYKIWGFDGTPAQMPPTVMNSGVEMTYELENEILIYRGFTQLIPTENQVLGWATTNGGNAELVAYSEAEMGDTVIPQYNDVTSDIDMVYSEIFPCIDFCADFIFHYGGSIPAKINVAEIFPVDQDGFLMDLWNMYQADPAAGFGAWVEAYRMDPIYDGEPIPANIIDWDKGEMIDIGYQVHNCYYIMVKLCIHLPQSNDYQGLTGDFYGKIGVIQWNDMCEPYVPPVTPP